MLFLQKGCLLISVIFWCCLYSRWVRITPNLIIWFFAWLFGL